MSHPFKVEVVEMRRQYPVVKVTGPDTLPSATNGEQRTVCIYPDANNDMLLLAAALRQLLEVERRYMRVKNMTEKQFTIWRRAYGASDEAVDDLIEAERLDALEAAAAVVTPTGD